MNILILKELAKEFVIYFYQPERNGSYGEIRMDIGGESAYVVSHSDADTSTGRYAFKATKAVEQRVQKQKFPLEFIQAWF